MGIDVEKCVCEVTAVSDADMNGIPRQKDQ